MTRWWFLLGGMLFAAGLGWWVLQVSLLDAADRSNASSYGQFVLAAIGILISLIALWKSFTPAGADPGLDELTDLLALAMRNQWTNAANDRRLLQPAPLPIRWCRTTEPVTGPTAAATMTRADHAPFDPLPGLDRITSSRIRTGTRRDLHRVYGGLASGRLLIIGGSGVGKSSAAVLLLLDALRYRDQAAPTGRPRIPVPVLFTLQGWDPTSTSVETWLSTKLTEIPMFRGRRGAPQATTLLRAGRVAVFLDGLDEVPGQTRSQALQALSDQTTYRLVLLSRTQELVNIARPHGLVGAAALELQPLKPADVADYLRRPLTEPAPIPWQHLTTTLATHPASTIARALNTPLAVSLLRDIYLPTAPVDELLRTGRFPSSDDITNYLLDHTVDAAYAPQPGQPPPRYTPQTAHRTLAFIAHELDQHHTYDFAWWTIPNWIPRAPRRVIGTLLGTTAGVIDGAFAGALIGTLLTGLMGVIAGAGAGVLISMLSDGLVGGLAGGLLGGFVGGLAFGFKFALMPGTTPTRIETFSSQKFQPRRGLKHGLVVGPLFGLMFGLAEGLASGLVAALLAGLLAWYFVGRATEVTNTDSASPVEAWRDDLKGWLMRGMAFGFVIVLALGLVAGIGLGLANVTNRTAVVGFMGVVGFGLVFGTLRGLLKSEGWKTAMALIYLRIRHNTPLRLMRFLDDARSRHLLRAVGPIFQFRHATLQHRLAR